MKFERVFQRGRRHYLKEHFLRARLYQVFCRLYFHCDIPFRTEIAEGVYFCHNAFGVVINSNAKLMGGVIQHGVTIGETDAQEAPTIGEDVFIGARAIVLGNIKVGNHAKIGAGAVVVKDVPPGSTVVGNPACIVHKGD